MKRTPGVVIAFLMVFAVICGTSRGGLNTQAQLSDKESNQKLMILYVSPAEKSGRFIDGLGKNDFQVFDEKVPQEIVSFDTSDTACSIGLIIDLSRSMQDPSMKRSNSRDMIKAAMPRVFELSNTGNDYFAFAFGKTATLISDWTTDNSKVLSQIDTVKWEGGTAIYDACYESLKKVLEGKNRKRAIILISDGFDNASKRSSKEVRELVKESGVLFYFVGLSVNKDFDSLLNSLLGPDQSPLVEISLTSGGTFFHVHNAADLLSGLGSIVGELRRQYSIGIRMADPQTKRVWHRLLVEVKAPARFRALQPITVRSRKGYYSF